MRQNLFIQFSRSCYFQGGGSLLLGGCYFQEVATFSGIYKRPQKIGINFREDATYRESLLSELLWYGQFRMLKIPKCEHSKLSPRLTGLLYLADWTTHLGRSPCLSCKHDQDKIRNYMDRRVTPPRRITSPRRVTSRSYVGMLKS